MATSRSLAIATTSLGEDKRGAPRIWIEGRKLDQAGFKPHVRYRMQIDHERRRILLELDQSGDRTVSRRLRDGAEHPIIDIVNAKALEPLKNTSVLRIDFTEGKVVIEPSAADARRLDRETRTMQRLKTGQPLRTGSVSTGLGALSLAIHEGLADQGLNSELAFSVEIDPVYQDLCAARNPCWREDTQAINMPLQDFAFDRMATATVEQIDILEAGIPCAAHSLAGRAKKHLAKPEDDPVAGHLVVGFLAIVAVTNPTVIIVENVPQYLTSASCAILTNQLREWGYYIHSEVLKGEEHGCLENRHRMALVATSQGMAAQITVELVNPQAPILGDYLEDIPEDSPLWSEMNYLKAKEERDRDAGKGFRMQILGAEATKVGTIGRGYAKIRSTEAKIRHPSNPSLLRQLTPVEHARIKGIPEALIDGISITTAHEMLGQSIVVAPFRALGRAIGCEMQNWVSGKARPRRSLQSLVSMPTSPANCNENASRGQLSLVF